MATITEQVGSYFRSVYSQLTVAQRILVIGISLAALIGVVVLVRWASTPDMVPLFSNLPAEEAGKVADWLGQNNIEYQLEQNGSRILLKREEVYDARIKLAQEGLPSPSSTGYEIFDATNLGMSEFVQKLNFRRALEGELSRTIEIMNEVDRARVHIVIPERALFREKEKPPTASVVLELKRGITESQVSGVAHLISSAVEGLEVEHVSILDNKGNLLSNLQDSDPLMSVSSTQLQLKENVEQKLTKKIESMLANLLGSGKAIVSVSADLDFSRSEVTEELYNPDGSVVRSEEVIESTSQSSDQDVDPNADPNVQPPVASSTSQNETNTITNYEVSKTLSHRVTQTGGIERLSASVMIDGTYEKVENADGETTVQYVPRSADELQKITQAVRNALGYSEVRGDEVSIVNIPFQSDQLEEQKADWLRFLQDDWYSLVQKLLFGLAIIGLLMYIRRLLSKSAEATRITYRRELSQLPKPQPSAGALPEPEESLALPDPEAEVSETAVKASRLQKQILDYVEEKPEVAAKLLRTWLTDE
ncbi:flagellar M-ring protein FliF [bacterium]|nr:flagellar M-ring protein FliF [bacterium]